MILVLVGSEVADDGRLPGFQGVCVLVRAVPGAWEDTGTTPSGLCKMVSPYRFSDTSDSTEIHWHVDSGMGQAELLPEAGDSISRAQLLIGAGKEVLLLLMTLKF